MQNNKKKVAGLSVNDFLVESGRRCRPEYYLVLMMSEVGCKQEW